jgi:hypothetical protein
MRRTDMRPESSRGKFLASALTAVTLLLIIGIRLVGHAESKTSHKGIWAMAGESTQEKIAGQCPQDQITFLGPHESSIQMRRAIQ